MAQDLDLATTSVKRPKTAAPPGATRPKGTSTTATRRAPRGRTHRRKDRLGQPATGVVVTGGASGIGRAICLALAEVGRPVAVWDRDTAGAKRTAAVCAEEYGVEAVGFHVDVADSGALGSAARRSLTALGALGGFVHAAGIDGAAIVTDLDEERWDRVQHVNLRAAALLTGILQPALAEAGPGSAIVYISSIEAFASNAFVPAYAASKAGLLALARSASSTLGAEGIRVNAVCPGAVDTPILAGLLAMEGQREAITAKTPLGRVGEPEDIAKVVRFLLSDEAGWITGASVTVDGGISALGPV